MGCLPVGVRVDLHKQKLGAEIDMQNKLPGSGPGLINARPFALTVDFLK